MIVAVFGLPGSGKSYLATFLSDQLDAVYISSDVIRRDVFPGKSNYSQQEKEQVYKEMLIRMNKLLEKEKSIVLDATFSNANIRAKFNLNATDKGESIIWIETWAEEEKTLARLSKPRPLSEADSNIYHLLKSQFDSMEEDHIRFHSESDSTQDLLERLRQL